LAVLVFEDLLASADQKKWIAGVKSGATSYTELDRLFPYPTTKLDIEGLKSVYKRFDLNGDGEVKNEEITTLF